MVVHNREIKQYTNAWLVIGQFASLPNLNSSQLEWQKNQLTSDNAPIEKFQLTTELVRFGSGKDDLVDSYGHI